MAKVGKASHRSKGERRSCNKLKKEKIVKTISPQVTTAMREAFEMAVCGHYAGTKKFVFDLMKGRSKHAGVARPSRGWTANVSRKTEDKLKAQGVFA